MSFKFSRAYAVICCYRRVALAVCVCLTTLSFAIGPPVYGCSDSNGGLSATPNAGWTACDTRPRSLRVLFVGNSYTYFNNLPALLSGLAASDASSTKIEAEMVVRGGASLKQHWEDGAATKKIKEAHWNFVVLQEQSTLPITDPETMKKYARLFDSEIRKAGARTVFFLTWARQNKPETQSALNNTYLAIARDLGAMVAPAGIAWQDALKENSKLLLYMLDQSHPNASGSYLAACVLYSVIVGKKPENLAATIRGRSVSLTGAIGSETVDLIDIDAAEASFLQRVAWNTVEDLNEHK